MTARYLARLDEAGNWKVVHFLWLHEDCRHLEILSRQAPRGVLWERASFLEHLLDCADQCSATCEAATIRGVVQHALAESESLRRACRSDRTTARVQDVSDRALAALERISPSDS
jgi:hypothetical protein